MHLPEKPASLPELDLMRRLKAYAEGDASWHSDGHPLGSHERSASQQLYSNLCSFVSCLQPLMDRVTAREMQAFTMHDHAHGLKVAHLMWHILLPQRRELLTPGEIALLIASAHLHDLGMGLSDAERQARLHPSSTMWDTVKSDAGYFKALSHLTDLSKSGAAGDAITSEALYQVQQAQEALLCLDCRERHATRDRYREILESLAFLHLKDPVNIPNVSAVLSFAGDSFEEKLIEICVSHNEDAHVLADPDTTNAEQRRFPTRYPIGCCVADIRLVAAALRLADVLDFDRERTPSILFHYLLPHSDDPTENVSVREWSKHLAISNWEIENERIIFRGRSPSAFIHHVVVEFCHAIEDEIRRTRSVFADGDWPFRLKANVEPAIEATGYRYIPYRFSLDEQRIYDLLMGKMIYPSELDAVRELIQNASDACKLRDALILSHDQSIIPSTKGRITIRYEEGDKNSTPPRLSVIDTGVGMDRYIIENYFLKVGRSYYSSSEFIRTRSLLRQHGLDFAPVAEFGIGFMSVFMLGDVVEVETAPWAPDKRDGQRRLLRIDGIGRLIEVHETDNTGVSRFYGTRITTKLRPRKNNIPTWEQIESYVKDVCRNLDYSITLEHVRASKSETTEIVPEGLSVPIPPAFADTAIRIPVQDMDVGLSGEIVLYRAPESRLVERNLADENPIRLGVAGYTHRLRSGILLRGGFNIGGVPGLPEFILTASADARVEVQKTEYKKRSLPLTDLGRSRLSEVKDIQAAIFKTWLDALLNNISDIEKRPIGSPDISPELLRSALWLQKYSALEMYRLARSAWSSSFKNGPEAIKNWEHGNSNGIWIGNSFARNRLLSSIIFDLVLPKITTIEVSGESDYFALPPGADWRERLAEWRTFIADDLTWPRLVPYRPPVADDFFDVYSSNNFLNKRYEDRLEGFAAPEIESLPGLLESLFSARDRGTQASFTTDQIAIVQKLAAIAGELNVTRFGTRRTISDLVWGRTPAKVH